MTQTKLKCDNPTCDFCVKGKLQRWCIINGGGKEHTWGIDSKTGKIRGHGFLNDTYAYEGDDYFWLPKSVIYGVCVDWWCLEQLSIYRKIAFVFQCIKHDRNVEKECSDREIERKVIFYYTHKKHQREGEWKCDLKNCHEDLESVCFRKAYIHFTKELYQLEKEINSYKIEQFRYCFCREDKWWEKFKPFYKEIMGFEKQK